MQDDITGTVLVPIRESIDAKLAVVSYALNVLNELCNFPLYGGLLSGGLAHHFERHMELLHRASGAIDEAVDDRVVRHAVSPTSCLAGGLGLALEAVGIDPLRVRGVEDLEALRRRLKMMRGDYMAQDLAYCGEPPF